MAKAAHIRSSRCVALAGSGKSPAHIHHRKNSGARAGKTAAGFFESGNFLIWRHYENRLLGAAVISECRPARWAQGNRDEETACGRTDRRLIFLVRGKSPGTCRRRCAGRRIGGGRPGTCRRRGGRADRIYRGAFDRAFLGGAAVGIVIPGSTCSTSQYRHAGASGRQGKPVADCRICRDAAGKNRRATARSGIGVTAPASG